MARQYAVHLYPHGEEPPLFYPSPSDVPVSYHPSADEALAHGRTIAAALAAAQGMARVIEEECEDGTLFFIQPWTDLPGASVPAVWVDELGRGNPTSGDEAPH